MSGLSAVVPVVVLALLVTIISLTQGVTLHLNGYNSIPTDGGGRILITDIGLDDDTTTADDADALLCQSDVETAPGNANWYLHPTQLSTAEGDRIQSTDPRGWARNRGINSDEHRVVRLKRHSTITAEEGVFTCHVVGASNTPISVGIYYPITSVSASIEVESRRNRTFRVKCISSGGRATDMYVTGPGGPYLNLNIQAVGTPQRKGSDSFFATTGIISGGSNGDTYRCVAVNGVSTPPTNSVQLRVANAAFITLELIPPTTVRVEWSQPSGGATVTGYVVHYSDGTTDRMESVAASSTSTDITGLTSGLTYTISVEATSQHLSGESDDMTITLGLSLRLTGYNSIPTDGSGRILITDIGLDDGTTTADDAGALLCQSDVAPDGGNGDWYLHPTHEQLSTEEDHRIQSTDNRGWSRNRGTDSNSHRLVRLKRHSTITAEEGVFTCHVVGASNTPISVGIYYPITSVSASIEVESGRNRTFRVQCISSGGRATDMYVTGPGGPYSNLNIQAVGTPQRMGGDSFSATTGIISGGSNGDTYQCTASNGVSTPPTNSVQLRVASAPIITLELIPPTTVRVEWSQPSGGATVTGYVVHYIDGTTDRMKSVAASSTSTDITDLTSGLTYTISVEATSQHLSGESEEKTIGLGQPTAGVGTTTATSISLSWSVPSGSVVDSYEVMWTSEECPGDVDEDSTTTTDTRYTIEDLREGTSYTITVSATNSAGTSSSDPVTGETDELTPSAAPTSVSVSEVTSSSITVQWGAVDCIHRNGDITGYSVRYGVQGSGSTQTMSVSGGSVTEVTISGLTPSTTYSIEVAAVNSAGVGVYSERICFQGQTGVFLCLKGVIIPNHGYVVISYIGSTNDTALICHTNRPTSGANSGGDWFGPNGMVVGGLTNNVPGFRRNRNPMIVRLYRNTATDPPLEGIFHCEVEDDTFTQQTVYVGLYNSGGGDIIISDGVALTVGADLKGPRPQFTLTCISTGGPATTVTWTRDSEMLTGSTVLNNATTAQYTHTLTVTGRLGGLYTCTVSNDKPSEDSAQLTVEAPSPPSAVSVSQNGLDSVLVSWTPPSGEPDVTGYIIYYQQDGGQRLSENAGATATTVTITGLIAGATYSIIMVATSSTLPSTETAVQTVTIEPATISLTSSPSSTIMAGDTVTLTCSVTLPTGVTGTPDLQWGGPGVTPTPADPTTSGQMTSSDLTLSDIATSQAGQYTCTATLSGSSGRETIAVIVLIPVPTPSITVSNTDTLYAGTMLSLTCDFTLSTSVDTPVLTAVTWMVDGAAAVTSPGRISTDGATLSFSPLATSDTGSYTCELTVTAPQTQITVQGPVQSAEENITVEVLRILQCSVNRSRSHVYIDCESLSHTSTSCSFDGAPTHQCELPLVLTLTVSPAGRHSVLITAFNESYIAHNTVEYSLDSEDLSSIEVKVPPLQVYLINDSPRVSVIYGDVQGSVEAEFTVSRPAAGVRCYLKSQMDRKVENCSSGRVRFSALQPGHHVLKIHAHNRRGDVGVVKRGFLVSSDPTYCSLVLINRGVSISESGKEATVETAGNGQGFLCVLDSAPGFICSPPVLLTGLSTGRHWLTITPLGCIGGSKTLSLHFTT